MSDNPFTSVGLVTPTTALIMSAVPPLHVLCVGGLEPNPHVGPTLLTLLQVRLLPTMNMG